MPQVGQHPHTAPLQLRGLRILVLVDDVLVQRHRHQGPHLGLGPRGAERRQVHPRHTVEHQLVLDEGVGAPRIHGRVREPVLGRAGAQLRGGVHVVGVEPPHVVRALFGAAGTAIAVVGHPASIPQRTTEVSSCDPRSVMMGPDSPARPCQRTAVACRKERPPCHCLACCQPSGEGGVCTFVSALAVLVLSIPSASSQVVVAAPPAAYGAGSGINTKSTAPAGVGSSLAGTPGSADSGSMLAGAQNPQGIPRPAGCNLRRADSRFVADLGGAHLAQESHEQDLLVPASQLCQQGPEPVGGREVFDAGLCSGGPGAAVGAGGHRPVRGAPGPVVGHLDRVNHVFRAGAQQEGDLVRGGRAVQAPRQRSDSDGQPVGDFVDAPRGAYRPGGVPQVAPNLVPDHGGGVGQERDAAVGVEAVDGVGQALAGDALDVLVGPGGHPEPGGQIPGVGQEFGDLPAPLHIALPECVRARRCGRR